MRAPALRKLLLQTLSFENANTECKKALGPLKAQGASLEEYIKACADIGSEQYKANLLAAALQSFCKQNHTKCFKCGKIGHMRKDCRKGQDKKKKGDKNNKTVPGLCLKCGKGKHWANECRSKLDKNGQPLQSRKNWRRGQSSRGSKINNLGYPQFPFSSSNFNQVQDRRSFPCNLQA